jgi:molybdopterin molybdotransferase
VAGLDADLVVTVGGASVGDYDVVRPALASLGWQADFDAVDMKPGRPTAFGRLGDGRLVLCLPGNPGTALICAHLFLHAFVAAALAKSVDTAPQTWPSAAALPANGGRETFLRARRTPDGALPFTDQDSALLRTFARTDLLIRRRAQAPAIETGAPVEVIDLRAY